MTSDHETSLDLAISILIGFHPCIDDIVHLAGRALGVCEESGHELDGCAMEYAFTEDTVIVNARINGSAEKAFAWIHKDPAGHHAFTRSHLPGASFGRGQYHIPASGLSFGAHHFIAPCAHFGFAPV